VELSINWTFGRSGLKGSGFRVQSSMVKTDKLCSQH
jgi:hypothetical protein